MRFTITVFILLVQISFGDILTGFNQIEVGNTWKYKYSYYCHRSSLFVTERGFRTVLLNDTAHLNDSIFYNFSIVDSVEKKILDLSGDTVVIDTVMSMHLLQIRDGNGFYTIKDAQPPYLFPYYLVKKDTMNTDTLIEYDKTLNNAEMWCKCDINNESTDFYIRTESIDIPFGWLSNDIIFAENFGLIYYERDGGDLRGPYEGICW